MGCSPSAVSPEDTSAISNNNNSKCDVLEKQHSYNKLNGHANSMTEKKEAKTNVNRNAKILQPQVPVPKSVAFDITLDGESGNGLLVQRKKPPHLRTLDPLDVPKLTAEQLVGKQRSADEKRERMKLKKINSSQKSSRRRKELRQAREFGMRQQIEQEKNELDDSLKQAGLKREQRLLEIKEKQRLREEKAKRIRERAKQIQNPDDNIEVEKDEEFNGASDDSWLGLPGNTRLSDPNEDKGLRNPAGKIQLTSSASTVNSYDAAFMRENKNTNEIQIKNETRMNGAINDEDFFGS